MCVGPPTLEEEQKHTCLYKEEEQRVLWDRKGSREMSLKNEGGNVSPLDALVRSDMEKCQEEREKKGMAMSKM